MITAAAWIAGYLLCGYIAARLIAPIVYEGAKDTYQILGPESWRESAMMCVGTCLLLGPFALLGAFGYALVNNGVSRFVPEIAERDRKQRIAQLEADLDAAHRQLGITPLKREAS